MFVNVITWRELYVLSIRNHTHPCLGYGKALKPRGMGPCWNLTATHTPNSRRRKKRWARKNSMSLQKRRGLGFACGRESGAQSSPLKFTTPRLLPKKQEPRMIRFFEKTLGLWNVVEVFEPFRLRDREPWDVIGIAPMNLSEGVFTYQLEGEIF